MDIGHSPYVLLVDGDDESQQAFKKFFDANGWQLTCVCDGQTGLLEAVSKKYDVIVTDLEIPGINGSSLIRNILKEKPDQAVMVVTSSPTTDQAVSLMRQGAVDLLQKPIDFGAVKESILNVVNSTEELDRKSRFSQHMTYCVTEYEFTTKQLATMDIWLPAIDNLLQHDRIDHRTAKKMKLAFQEAVINSLEHGNLELVSAWREQFDAEGMDKYTKIRTKRLLNSKIANRKIFVRAESRPADLTIMVKDQGPGFNPPVELKHKTIDTRELLVYGRGIMIIASIMDRVWYEDNGRKIIMVKKL